MGDPRKRHGTGFAIEVEAHSPARTLAAPSTSVRPRGQPECGLALAKVVWAVVRAGPTRTGLVLLVLLGAVLLALVLWLRPELLGYQYYMLPFKPDCIVMQPGFKTGGNGNRMEALFNAFHLIQARNMRYLAVPEDWQAWLCKIYTPESIWSFPVPVVPTETGAGCPAAFWPLYQERIRRPEADVCEQWHVANFFRLPWYWADLHLRVEVWRHLLPTARQYRETAELRVAQLREQHLGKILVTVHKRWLTGRCSRDVRLDRLATYPIIEQFCHLTPTFISDVLECEAGLAELPQTAHLVVSSDGYMPDEERLFAWEFEPEETPFMAQLWTWVLSDVHIGHPNSTIDQVACRFRRLLCGSPPFAKCRPCYPLALEYSIADEFQSQG